MKKCVFYGFYLVIGAMLLVAGGCGQSTRDRDALDFRHPAIRRARAKLAENNKAAALALFKRAVDEKPDLAQAHLDLAQLYDEFARDYLRAIYHYERYLELRSDTEKRGMIEGFVRKAKMAYAASMAEQFGADKKLQALTEENAALRQSLRQVRANLAELSSAAQAAPKAGVPLAADGGMVSAAKPAAGEAAYVVQPGDTLSSIASKVYQNPRLWKKIYDANRVGLGGKETLKVGQTLIIPK